MKTPQEHTITIASGAYYDLCDFNRMVTFYDVTLGATLNWGIDDDPKQRAREGFAYELPEHETFKRIRLFNDGAASLTVVVTLAEGRVYDNRSQLSELLDSIDDRLDGETALTQLADTAVAATGAAGTLLFAANADRKRVVLQACEGNGDYVYIGKDNTVSDVNKMGFLSARGSILEVTYQGAIYAVGGVAAQEVCGYEV